MDKRKLGVLFACLLGTALAVYLSGLLGQLMHNYEAWSDAGGMAGDALIQMPDPSITACIANAFTARGLKAMLLLAAVGAGALIYLKFSDRFGSRDFDERNFKRSRSGVYGTAGWMEPKEMQKVLRLTPPDKAMGAILGERDGKVYWLPEDTRLNKHVAIFGASGTGKSRGVIRPCLLQCVKRGESVILSDTKSDLYNDMSEYFRENGYEVRVFNLVDPLHGDSWNCMSDLHGDTLMAQVLTDVIISNTSEGKGNHFWDNGEANLLKALVMYVDHSTALDEGRKNLPEVYRFLTQTSERELNSLFERLPVEHPAKAPYNLFRQSSDTVRSGILLGLGTRLQILQSQAIRRITSRSDIDLALPATKKCAYFVIISDQESSLDFLSSLFFSFLFIRLVRYADSTPEGRCPIPVNLVLDEFNNLGSIGGSGGRDFARSISTLRSRAVSVMLATQSLPQLQNRYPDNIWAEILGNCDTQIMLGCTDSVTAEYTSMRTGDMTVEVNSTMTTRQTMAVAQVIPQYRYSEGVGKRRLLTTDEVLRLSQDDILVMLRGQKVLKCQRFDYTRHPDAKRLRRSSIQDYSPQPYSEPMPLREHSPKPIRPTVSNLYETATPPENF